jgi:hypothetical protein
MERSGIQGSKTPPDFGASRLHPGYSPGKVIEYRAVIPARVGPGMINAGAGIQMVRKLPGSRPAPG